MLASAGYKYDATAIIRNWFRSYSGFQKFENNGVAVLESIIFKTLNATCEIPTSVLLKHSSTHLRFDW